MRLLVEVAAEQAETLLAYLARVGARATPLDARAPAPRIAFGACVIDTAGSVVTLDGRDLPLTAKELALLVSLARHAGSFVSRDSLMREVWGRAPNGSRTVDLHVRRLRAKLGRYGHAIETRVRVGYRLVPEVFEGGRVG